MRSYRSRVALFLVTATIFLSWTASASAESDLERHLNDQYKGKTLILRGFYPGNHLKYDPSGEAVNPRPPDDWTVSGVVEIENFTVKGDELVINARRIHLGWPKGSFEELHDRAPKLEPSEKKNRALRIEAILAPSTPGAADGLLGRIFLTSSDRFVDLVPDYWRSCVRASITGEAHNRFGNCRFSPDFMAIPGVSSPMKEVTEAEEETSGGQVTLSSRNDIKITAPKAVSQREPRFTEDALRAKCEGTVFLSLVVDESGHPRDIEIVSPIGMGLDRNAVSTVSKWKFEPGTKNGSPVPVTIQVQVEFRTY